MFAKCVLRAEQRGVRPSQAFILAENRLERWASGDRVGLWREVIAEDARIRNKGNKQGGISGKAIQALITPGVAADMQLCAQN